MKSEEEIRPLLDINVNELLDECLVQPRFFLKYATELRKTNDDVQYAETELRRIEAHLSQKIRDKPEKYKLDKLTDSVVKQTVRLRPMYQKALKKHQEAMSLQGMLEVAVKALYQRKDMLEHAIKLHGQSYFSVPYAPGDLSRLAEEMKTNRSLRSKKKKKRG